MDFERFFDELADQVPLVISVRDFNIYDLPKLVHRTSVAVGCGLPKLSWLHGHALSKGPQDRSLSEVVLQNGTQLLEKEPIRNLMGQVPSQLLKNLVFFVKDASPDSLLAVIILLAKLSGVQDMKGFERWIESISTWDEGMMPANPYQSWSALASALSHSRFPLKEGKNQTTTDHFQYAWKRSFNFLTESMHSECDPEAMPVQSASTYLHRKAVTALRRMEQLYEEIHGHGKILQLSVPLRDAPGRRVMVDALCYVEDEPSDAVKVFGRFDRERSPGRRGFALAASYRPYASAWNRFTIHADPRANLDLTALWELLEWKETDKWRDMEGWISRAADKETPSSNDCKNLLPRSFKTIYDLDRLRDRTGVARSLANVCNIWVNPWFVNSDASLIGSPGLDCNGKECAPSCLEWGEVVNTIWEVYNPLSGIQFYAFSECDKGSEQTVKLIDVQPIYPYSQSADGPFFRYLEWPDNENHKLPQARSIDLNDTTIGLFAALANRGEGPLNHPIRLEELSPTAACKHVTLNGGFAVLAQNGCVVVDDWHDQALNRDEVFRIFGMANDWFRQCEKHLEEIKRLNSDLSKLNGESGQDDEEPPRSCWKFRVRSGEKEIEADKNIYRLIERAVQNRSLFITAQEKCASSHIKDVNARILYDSLLDFWGLSLRATHIDQSYAQFEQSIKSLQDVRSAWLLKIISRVGLPAAAANGLSKPFAEGANSFLSTSGIVLDLPDKWVDSLIAAGQVLSWMLCTLFLVFCVNLINYWWSPAGKPKGK